MPAQEVFTLMQPPPGYENDPYQGWLWPAAIEIGGLKNQMMFKLEIVCINHVSMTEDAKHIRGVIQSAIENCFKELTCKPDAKSIN